MGLLASRYPDARFDYYPGRGTNDREIKMNLRSWDARGFPFAFMPETNDEDGKPRVRALIWRESYEERADALASWAIRTTGMEDRAIDGNFSLVAGWGWRKIFPEDDHPGEAALVQDAFDPETARAAFDAVVELVEELRPYVEDA